jgi:hypothetical protein
MSIPSDIENVALAIFDTEHGPADRSWDEVGDYARQTYRIMAKAAILATLHVIRIPSTTMIQSALETEIYQRLIDAKRAEIEAHLIL